MSPDTEHDGVVAVFHCENCDGLLRSRFPKDPDSYYGPPVCGSCDRGPTTRIYGAVEPIGAVEQGIAKAGMRGLIVGCEPIRDNEEWDFEITVKVQSHSRVSSSSN